MSRLLRSKSRLTNNATGKVTTRTTCGSVALNAPVRGVGWVGPFAKLKGHYVEIARLIIIPHKSEVRLKPNIPEFFVSEF